MKHFILPVNFGNDSIALIQWAYEKKLSPVTVTYADTGWAAPEWPKRVEHCKTWVKSLGFEFVLLKSKADFPTLVREQNGFPTRKFQWCAGFLKGLPLLAWLDKPENDPNCTATILLAHRRSTSRNKATLAEFIEESEHYGERKVWHPLYAHSPEERNQLIQRVGFEILSHRSLECDPCINSDACDVARMSPAVLAKMHALETEMNQKMLDPEAYNPAKTVMTNSNDLMEMGCGTPYGCGL